jgi:large repetitive protein
MQARLNSRTRTKTQTHKHTRSLAPRGSQRRMQTNARSSSIVYRPNYSGAPPIIACNRKVHLLDVRPDSLGFSECKLLRVSSSATAVTYDGEVNPVPGAVVAYVIEQDVAIELDNGARFNASSAQNPPNGQNAPNGPSAANAVAISANGKVLITTTDNNGRSAARPTMGSATGTVRVTAYAMPANTAITTALVESFVDGSALVSNASQTLGAVGLAGYQISVLQQSDGPTQFTGKILDHTGKPLQGVRVTISRTPLSVTTDAEGSFTFLQDVPHGKLDLFVDGRAVTGTTPLPGNQSSPTQYPSLHFEVLAIRGQKNILPHPIYLPPLLMSEAKIVGGNEDVTLKIPGFEGFEMIVKANSVTFPDGSRVGPLVVSPVHVDRLPMVPPGGAAAFPAPAWTIQPTGTRFDPPIEVRMPNDGRVKIGESVPVIQWDHDLGQFVPMGRGTASEDGAQVITDPGSGITKAGWGGLCVYGPPPPLDNCGGGGASSPTCSDCEKEQSSSSGNNCPPKNVCVVDTQKQGKKCGNNACKACNGKSCNQKFSESAGNAIAQANIIYSEVTGSTPSKADFNGYEGQIPEVKWEFDVEAFCSPEGNWKFRLNKADIKTAIRFPASPAYIAFSRSTLQEEEARVTNLAVTLPSDAPCQLYPGLDFSLRWSASSHYPGNSSGNPAIQSLTAAGRGAPYDRPNAFDTRAEILEHEKIHFERFKTAFNSAEAFGKFKQDVEQTLIPIQENDSVESAKQRFKSQYLRDFVRDLNNAVNRAEEAANAGDVHRAPDEFYAPSIFALTGDFALLRQRSTAKNCPAY